MKVNMNLLDGGAEAEEKPDAVPAGATSAAVDEDIGTEAEDDGDGEEEDEIDESSSHSKLKTALLVALMVGGFGLFVWNMTGVVNNLRLDSQGFANVNYSIEQSVDNYMDSSEGSGSISVDDHTESEVPTDAARDGPEAEEAGGPGSADRDEISGNDAELIQRVRDAENREAFTAQQLKNAEDMLDSALAREAALQEQLDSLGAE